MKYQILQGDNRDTLKSLPDNSIDAIVTDPPYGIDFLGKGWDANTGALETYQQCLRVLKPGGHILAFSAARTYHHLAITLEQAGFEIRDQIMWIYSSGFPKSQDIGRSIQRGIKDSEYYSKEEWEDLNGYKGMPSGDQTFGHNDLADGQKSAGLSGKVVKVTDPVAKQWSGWGTQLKPAHEPIALARKPIKLSIARNCQTHGVGALNIDATRVPYEDQKDIDTYLNNKKGPMERSTANDGEGIGMFEGKVGYKTIKREVSVEQDLPELGRFPSNVIGEIEAPYQKYFYCPKVGRAERHVGFVDPGPQTARARDEDGNTLSYAEKVEGVSPTMLAERFTNSPGNNHPTVKPIELMKYLIRLITPPGGVVLDPFNGSGSTGCAAVELGLEYIGCELDPAYVDIARTRIEAWYAHTHPLQATGLFE